MKEYIYEDKNNCCGCGGCANICPHNAVRMQKDEYGFVYPVVDADKCVNCNLCLTVCQKVNKNESDMPLMAFAASHRSKEVLRKSSSGGVFSAIAEYFLNNGGAVCGCVFDDKLNAVHICTEKKDDFLRMRKSKYIQSDVGFIYREVKTRLKSGQHVLFTGTPCQVAALYSVVGREHENLTTMDLVCHGVPSQYMFDRFIKYLEKKYKTQIVNFNFRSKKYGWQRYTLEFTDAHRHTTNIGKRSEFYIPSFTGGNTIRPSCLSCKYACANRIGDITIGDFWGHEKLDLKCDISDGTSIFTINNERSMKWLDILSKNLIYEKIDYSIAVNGNTCLQNPTPRGKERDIYMQALRDDKIEELALKYQKNNKKTIMREKIKLSVPLSVFTFLMKKKSR